MPASKPATVAEYLHTCPAEVQPLLQEIIKTIRKVVPDVEEMISYDIPAYKVRGQTVIYFAAWKKHIALYPVSEKMRNEIAGLEGYKGSKGSIHFPLGEPLPMQLIEEIVRNRARLLQD